MLALLAACSSPSGESAAPPSSSMSVPGMTPAASGTTGKPIPALSSTPHSSQFVSKRWHFTIANPPDAQVQRDFHHSYLQAGTWKTYATPESHGLSVVALTMPGSNHITDAEVRIGVSTAQPEVTHCSVPPQAVRAGSVGKVDINGIEFTRFEAGDAAMSHYLDVHSYRVVHAGTCYAIDLLVYGTNPEVYSPPATPPFTSKQAFARMQAVLDTFRFTK